MRVFSFSLFLIGVILFYFVLFLSFPLSFLIGVTTVSFSSFFS
nr:MAG TPA: hypothetical protein [Caudoviricetes sp.]